MTKRLTAFRFIVRGIRCYFAEHVGIAVSAGVAAAVVSAALLTAAAIRAGIAARLGARLGNVRYVLRTRDFFSGGLVTRIADGLGKIDPHGVVSGGIALEGTAGREAAPQSAAVRIHGIDENFFRLGSDDDAYVLRGREAVVSAELAGKLALRPGDAFFVTLATDFNGPHNLFRKRGGVRRVRLIVGAVAVPGGIADFTFTAGLDRTANVFCRRDFLIRALELNDVANFIAIGGPPTRTDAEALAGLLAGAVTAVDVGLIVRKTPSGETLTLNPKDFVFDEFAAEFAQTVAGEFTPDARAVSAYLANSISANGRSTPYSTAAGVAFAHERFNVVEGTLDDLRDDEIAANSWIAEDLALGVGDTVAVAYFVRDESGAFVERVRTYRLAAIVALRDAGADRTLVPLSAKMEESISIGGWELPFRIETGKIRPVDDAYWERHRAAPKIFLTYPALGEIWRENHGFVGPHTTGIRADGTGGRDAESVDRAVRRVFAKKPPFGFRDAAAEVVRASVGSSDYAALFSGLAFFVIVAALAGSVLIQGILLARRQNEFGLLAAAGIGRRRVGAIYVTEFFLAGLPGVAVGAFTGAYLSGLNIGLLKAFCPGAFGASAEIVEPVFDLQSIFAAFLIGAAFTAVLPVFTVGRMRYARPVEGVYGIRTEIEKGGAARSLKLTLAVAAAGAGLSFALWLFDIVGAVPLFFALGFFLLTGLVVTPSILLAGIRCDGRGAAVTGIKMAFDRPARALVVIGACAFPVYALSAAAANTGVGGWATGRSGPTGGIDYVVATGRVANPEEIAALTRRLGGAVVYPLTISDGAAISCLNIAEPVLPAFIGVSDALIASVRFRLRVPKGCKEANPWAALQKTDDGFVPAVVDAASATWILKKGLGDTMAVGLADGRMLNVRICALIEKSFLADTILIHENRFRERLAPRDGCNYFLIANAGMDAAGVGAVFAEFAPSVTKTEDRLAELAAVERAYTASFVAVSALGVLVGMIGLALAYWQHYFENRQSVGLLLALGLPRSKIRRMLFAGNLVLTLCGILSGVAAGLFSGLPAIAEGISDFRFAPFGVIIGIVLTVGIAASGLSVGAPDDRKIVKLLRNG